MAFSEPEPEPNCLGVSHLESFDPNGPVINASVDEFISNLQSEALLWFAVH